MTTPVPPSRQIAADIRDRIKAGKLKPGDKIPSLHELVQEYDVHRITADKAVKILREEGLVESVRGLGTYVREVSDA